MTDSGTPTLHQVTTCLVFLTGMVLCVVGESYPAQYPEQSVGWEKLNGAVSRSATPEVMQAIEQLTTEDLADARTVSLLLKLALDTSSDGGTRRLAVLSFQKADGTNQGILSALNECLSSHDESINKATILVLKKLAEKQEKEDLAISQLLAQSAANPKVTDQIRIMALQSLRSIGMDSIVYNEVFSIFRSESNPESIRLIAAQMLVGYKASGIQKQSVVTIIESELKRGSFEWRRGLGECLCKLQCDAAISVIRKVIQGDLQSDDQRDLAVAEAVVRSLFSMSGRSSLELQAEALQSKDANVALLSVQHVSLTGKQVAPLVPWLAMLARSNQEELRLAAIKSLADIAKSKNRANSRFQRLLKDNDKVIGILAASVLNRPPLDDEAASEKN